MKDEKKLEYLDEERKKIWARLTQLEVDVEKRMPDYEREAKGAANKAVEHKNRSEEAKTAAVQNQESLRVILSESEGIRSTLQESISKLEAFQQSFEDNSCKMTTLLGEFEQEKQSVQTNVQQIKQLSSVFEEYDKKSKGLVTIFDRGDEYDSKIDSLYNNILQKRKEIESLYLEIMGYTVNNEPGGETVIPGRKNELEMAYVKTMEQVGEMQRNIKSIEEQATDKYVGAEAARDSDFKKAFDQWSRSHDAVYKKIQSLLPNALTAGLSYAFATKKEDENKERQKHTRTFNTAIGGLILVSLIPFVISIFLNEGLEKEILGLPKLVLSILPLYIPCLWVAYSASKKINLSKRLSEEYAHKEVLSRTFEGLAQQINNVEDKNTSYDLRNRLLYSLLEVSAENPGKLISDYDKADHPLMDALDKSVKLANAVEKVGKIPGFSKLVKVLEKKSNKLMGEEGKKVSDGLDALNGVGVEESQN